MRHSQVAFQAQKSQKVITPLFYFSKHFTNSPNKVGMHEREFLRSIYTYVISKSQLSKPWGRPKCMNSVDRLQCVATWENII